MAINGGEKGISYRDSRWVEVEVNFPHYWFSFGMLILETSI